MTPLPVTDTAGAHGRSRIGTHHLAYEATFSSKCSAASQGFLFFSHYALSAVTLQVLHLPVYLSCVHPLEEGASCFRTRTATRGRQ